MTSIGCGDLNKLLEKEYIMNTTIQNKRARVAGLAYLLIVIVPLLSMLFIDSRISVKDDLAATINNILANELLFRIDLVITLSMFIGVIVLSVLLYEVLKPVNPYLARVALFIRFSEAIIGLVAVLSSFIFLLFLKGESNSEVFASEQFLVLARLFKGVYWEATIIVFVLLAIGSIICFYLFYISKIIPKALSIWGMICYALVLIGALISLVFSGNAFMILGSQTILFEIVIGCWLLFKGLKYK